MVPIFILLLVVLLVFSKCLESWAKIFDMLASGIVTLNEWIRASRS